MTISCLWATACPLWWALCVTPWPPRQWSWPPLLNTSAFFSQKCQHFVFHMLIFPFVDFPMKKGISASFVIFAHFGEPHECPYNLQSLIMISFLVYSAIILRHSQKAHQFLPLFLIFPWKEGKLGLICNFCSLWWAPWVTPWLLINNHDFLYCIFFYFSQRSINYFPISWHSHQKMDFCHFCHFCPIWSPYMCDPSSPVSLICH